jgi:sulfur carrier protein ThiS
MTIILILRKKEFRLEGVLTVREALEKLELSTESHLAVKDGELLVESDTLRDGDIVKLVSSISGG